MKQLTKQKIRHWKATGFKGKLKIIERFIKQFLHGIKIVTKDFIIKKKLIKKFFQLLWYLVVASFTGIIIYYAITHFNWVSIAIIATLGQHYIEWLIKTIKEKTE